MPSLLRHQSSFEPFSAETTQSYYPKPSPPQKKQKMSLSQTYYIAASARSKLGKEACRPDHNLRLLVGHANLLDSLMLELQDAERQQEAWFNQTVRKAAKAEEPRHIQWADTIVEDEDDEEEDADDASETSDSDSEYDEAEFDMIRPSVRRLPSSPVTITTTEMDVDDDAEYYEDFEDDEEHALTRVSSTLQPPELVHDDDYSDDDSPPASPPQPALHFTEQQRQAIATTGFFDQGSAKLSPEEQAALSQDGYFIPERTTPMIAAC